LSHVDLPEEVVRLAEAQVAAGRAGSIEDVVRAGVLALEREQRLRDARMDKLRAAVDEGDASGVYEGDPFGEIRGRHHLPSTAR
jgi:putative addiction module CopG family antidote